jgi:hypothetical protein
MTAAPAGEPPGDPPLATNQISRDPPLASIQLLV